MRSSRRSVLIGVLVLLTGFGIGPVQLPAGHAAPAAVSWSSQPTVVPLAPTASARTAEQVGSVVFPVHQTPTEVNVVRARPPAMPVTVDVRGLRADGNWSEWQPSTEQQPAQLPEPTRSVQARLMVTATGPAPRVDPVEFTAWHDQTHTARPRTEAAANYRLFATREGLVGGTTANGHVIRDRDHFVALPSRRGLSAQGGGEYTVRVCTDTRCAWAPVWDVGPWNTKDDHWNADREQFGDLPRGLPQAQAAYEDGYHGGTDGSGRRVANPAGIDLADGVFWDGLQLGNNGWVQVHYEWTGGGARGTVTADPLNVRAEPASAAAQVGTAGRDARVPLACQLRGESVFGNDVWFRVSNGMYVSGAYIDIDDPPGPC